MSEVLSLGIDIGTTTTQIIFSKLRIENTASSFSVPSIEIVDKRIVYKGDIHLTPFRNLMQIDGDKIRQMIESDFQKSGFSPQDVITGAIIITGEAARKENTAVVLERLSDFAGEFVVSAAGPDLESILAGKGSGAQRYSKDNRCVVANLDIGGGTSNISVFNDGEVSAKGCLDIGGRLIKLRGDNTVEYISPSSIRIAESLGIFPAIGKQLNINQLNSITGCMNSLLEQAMGYARGEKLLEEIRTPGSSPFIIKEPIDYLCFSGGVAEYIYNEESNPFLYGDIGVLLGRSIKNGKLVKQGNVIGGSETVRATVVGAGSYAVTVSGSTITISHGMLPIKNVPVLYIGHKQEKEGALEDAGLLSEIINWFLKQYGRKDIVLAFHGDKNESYYCIEQQAKTIGKAVTETLPDIFPVVIVIESDIAKVMGQALCRFLGGKREVVCIDGVKVSQGDYVDIGKPLMGGLVVPVVVKTLIFG